MNIYSSFKNILPTNICFNARVANKYNDQKPSAFKWAPIINHNNFFLIYRILALERKYIKEMQIYY